MQFMSMNTKWHDLIGQADIAPKNVKNEVRENIEITKSGCNLASTVGWKRESNRCLNQSECLFSIMTTILYIQRKYYISKLDFVANWIPTVTIISYFSSLSLFQALLIKIAIIQKPFQHHYISHTPWFHSPTHQILQLLWYVFPSNIPLSLSLSQTHALQRPINLWWPLGLLRAYLETPCQGVTHTSSRQQRDQYGLIRPRTFSYKSAIYTFLDNVWVEILQTVPNTG